MPEQEMGFQEKDNTNASLSYRYDENERYASNSSFEKLNPQAIRHSLKKRLILALCSIILFILLALLFAGLANGIISFHHEYASKILITYYVFLLLLLIATITVNILYNRKHR